MPKERIHNLLKEKIKALNYFKYQLRVKEASTGGANYTSNLYKVEIVPISRKHQVLKLFVKVASPSVRFRNTLDEFKIYTTEDFFYSKLLPKFKALEEENGVPDNQRLIFPKYYGSNPVVYEEILLLEDLSANKWLAYDRFKPINWPYAQAAMTEIAKFHALSFAYSEKDPDEFKKVLEKFKININDDSLASFVQSSREVALQNVDPEYKELLEEYLKDFEAKIKKVNEPIGQNVITHGDFRPSNLMHKIREDGTVEIRIVDLQTLQGASPVVDLLYFIFTGSDEQFRAQYFRKLVEHYYSELVIAMRRLQLDHGKLYPRTVFDYEMKQKLPYGLTIAVFTLPVVTVSVENAPKINEDMDLSAFTAEKASELYVTRLNGVVRDYVKWGYLKPGMKVDK